MLIGLLERGLKVSVNLGYYIHTPGTLSCDMAEKYVNMQDVTHIYVGLGYN